MKAVKFIAIFTLLLFVNLNFSLAQVVNKINSTENTEAQILESNKKLEKLKGTYEVQIRGQLREPVALPVNLADIISEKRAENKTVYHEIVNNKVRIKILPKSTISSTGFKPLPSQTIYAEFPNE